MTKTTSLLGGCSAAALALWLPAAPAAAQAQMRDFAIPAGDLGPALNAFARQAAASSRRRPAQQLDLPARPQAGRALG